MKNCIEGLKVKPDYVITDGNMTLDINFLQKYIIGGDAKSYTIGAASIIAKVYRDKLMDKFDAVFPGYDFAKNKGYGTQEHIQAIKEHGLCLIHRRTFTKNF
jgi:ribonuclease HII